jgi:RHS repeat-associated protein
MSAVQGQTSSYYSGPPPATYICYYYYSYIMRDWSGATHPFVLQAAQNPNDGTTGCNLSTSQPNSTLFSTIDFYQAITTVPTNVYEPNPVSVVDPDGTVYSFSPGSNIDSNDNVTSYWGVANYIEDRNGNVVQAQFAQDPPGVAVGSIVDTAGRSISVSGLSNNTQTISVTGIANPYVLTWESVPVNFSINSTAVGAYPCTGIGVAPDQSSNYVLKSITLPNDQSYQFQYTDGYGLLSQITYPSGGFVRYSWSVNPQSEFILLPAPPDEHATCGTVYDSPAITERQVSYDGVNIVQAQLFNYQTTWSAPPSFYTWSSKQTTVTTSESGGGFTTAYTYAPYLASPVGSAQAPAETKIVYSDFNGNTLKTVYKNWQDLLLMSCELEQLGNGLISADFYTYGLGSQVTDKKEYDYGVITSTSACNSAAPANPTRETVTAYQSFNPTPIFPSATSIFDRPSSVKTYAGGTAGTLMAETDYAYDGTGVSGVSPLSEHDETNYPASYNVRANATTRTVKCLQSGCGNTATTYAYDETGQITSVTDPCGNGTCSDMKVASGTSHTAYYYYADNYSNHSAVGTNTYLTKIVDRLNHTSLFAYDYNSGQLTQSQDQNDINANRAGTVYTYDSYFFRPTGISYPDSGQTNIVYNDAPPTPTVTRCELINGSSGATCSSTSPPSGWKTSVNVMDGMGHVTQTQLMSDPDGPAYVDTSYDGFGRVHTRSNPHRYSGASSDGTTTYTYDSLGRTVEVSQPDGSDIETSYSGNCATVADEVGAIRESCSDAFGRVTQVVEPGAGSQNESAGAATVTINGSEQSANVSATPGKGSVTIGGSEMWTTYYPCGTSSCPTTIYDSGTVSVTVNGYTATAGYGQYDTPSTIATALVSATGLNSSSSPVTASASGAVVTMTAKSSGVATNYSLSSSSATSQPTYFNGASFSGTPSGPNLTGGQNAGTMYDSGTVTLTVNATPATVSYGNGSTSSSIASALVNALNAPGSLVVATANGATISLTATDAGSDSNYLLSSTVAWNTEDFSHASFSVSAPSALSGGTNGNLGSSPLVTQYAYDVLNNLTCAVQKGTDTTAFTTCAAASANWRQRAFVYDSLSRLTSASNPESGTITYSYDLNSNLATRVSPKAGQTGTAQTTHLYTYDTDNRVLAETHLDPTSGTDMFAYDGNTLTGCPQPSPPAINGGTNLIGRRSAMCSYPSASSFSYDPMGRVSIEARKNKGSSAVTYTTTYSYNEDGSVNKLTYPSGDAIAYLVGGAGRATQVTDSNNNTFATAATYAPHGALTGMTNGSGIVTSNIYNDRLQPTLLSAGLTGQTPVLSLCYDFHSGVPISAPSGSPKCQFNAYTSGNNGNVFQVIDNVDSTRSAAFAYDALNRVAQANTINTTSGNCWGEVYTIDTWGNLTNVAGVSSMGNCWHETLMAAPASNLNQLNGYCYDAAGNLSLTGACPQGSLTPTWAYDSENRLRSTAGYTYSYDADGVRVEKSNGSSGTMYWTGPGGEYLTETDLTGTINEEYIFFAGQRIARVDRPSGTVHYYFSDHLGSTSVITDPKGNVQEHEYFYPYGGIVATVGSDSNHYEFTGKERDGESGLDYFEARHYGSSLGRFMQADPLYIEMNRLADPQLLNLYSYVRNNPLSLTDPTGMLVDVNCQQVSSEQCAQTVTDFNNRQGAQFQVTRDDKTGQLNVADSQNVDPTKLSGGEKALYDAITNKDATGTLTVVGNDSSFDFEKSTGKGANSLDRSDLNALNGADKRLSGEVIAHAALESYDSAKPGVSVDQAHDFATGFFGFKYGMFTPNWGTTVNTLGLNWRATRLNETFRAQMKLVTPIPRATFNQMVKEGGTPGSRDVTSVEIVPNK